MERIQFLLNALGNPERAFPAVHVAGTNGKGSTSAMIASVLRAAGLRVGLFTSPHLVRYNERIVVDGRRFPMKSWTTLMGELEPLCAWPRTRRAWASPPSSKQPRPRRGSFRRAAKVDVAVVEVGLGGSLDSTNVVRPIVSVITPIGLDHTNRLGKTLARDRPGQGGYHPAGRTGRQTQRRRRRRHRSSRTPPRPGAPLLMAGRDFDVRLRGGVGPDGTEFDVKVPVTDGEAAGAGGHAAKAAERWMKGLRVPLLGAHQAGNGAVAAVRVSGSAGGGRRAGARGAASPGAASRARSSAAPCCAAGGAPGQVGGNHRNGRAGGAAQRSLARAHGGAAGPARGHPGWRPNAEAAAVLAEALRAVFPSRRPVFVFAALREKPVDRMLEQLLPLGRAVVLTAPRSSRTPPMDSARAGPPGRQSDRSRFRGARRGAGGGESQGAGRARGRRLRLRVALTWWAKCAGCWQGKARSRGNECHTPPGPRRRWRSGPEAKAQRGCHDMHTAEVRRRRDRKWLSRQRGAADPPAAANRGPN